MSGFAEILARRFGDGGPAAEGAEDNELMRRVLQRKTVRRYSDRMPDEALLDLLTACALSASAKSDFQQASILRLRDGDKRAAIGALFPAMPWIAKAPVFFVFLGDARRLHRVGELRGKPVANGTLEGFFNASIDAALAMQTMILCAESSGLGVCPISVIRNEADKVGEILGLPDLVFPVAGLCLGYPSGRRPCQPAPSPSRDHAHRPLRRQRACGFDRRLRSPSRRHSFDSQRPASIEHRIRRGGFLWLVGGQGASGGEGRGRGVSALSAQTRIHSSINNRTRLTKIASDRE